MLEKYREERREKTFILWWGDTRLKQPCSPLHDVIVDSCNNSSRLHVLKWVTENRKWRPGKEKEQHAFWSLISSLWGFLSCLERNKGSENLSKAGSRGKQGKITAFCFLCLPKLWTLNTTGSFFFFPHLTYRMNQMGLRPALGYFWSWFSQILFDSHHMVMVPLSDEPTGE